MHFFKRKTVLYDQQRIMEDEITKPIHVYSENIKKFIYLLVILNRFIVTLKAW